MPVDRVNGRRIALIEARTCEGGQLAACGKTHHSGAMDIDMLLHCPAPHQPNSALRVGKFRSLDRIRRAAFPRQPVFENERRDPVLLEPSGHVVAFMVDPNLAVASTRDNDHRDTARRAGCWQKWRDGRLADMGQHMLALGSHAHSLGPPWVVRVGSSGRPQKPRFGCLSHRKATTQAKH